MLKESYLKTSLSLLDRVYLENQSTIEALAPLIADSVAAGGVIHTFGSGHSEIIGREMVGRAGGLVCVSAISRHNRRVYRKPTGIRSLWRPATIAIID